MNDYFRVSSLLDSEYSDGIDSILQLKSEPFSLFKSSYLGLNSLILQLSGFLSTGLGLVMVDSPVGSRTDVCSETSVAML